MSLRTKGLMLVLIFILLSGCSINKMSKAEFTNLSPAKIKINNSTYVMTDEILSTDSVEEQVGKITKVNTLVSYLPDKDPYKNPNRIFKLKDLKFEEAIAVEVNDKLYKAKIEQ